MSDNTVDSRYFQIALKVIAVVCGLALLYAAAQNQSVGLDSQELQQFILSQLQNPVQLKLLVGLAFLVAGIFLPMPQKNGIRYSGPKDLQHDSYKLYLVTKYKIERNAVLDQLVCRNELFASLDGALSYAHALECPRQLSPHKTPSRNPVRHSFSETIPASTTATPAPAPSNASFKDGQESKKQLPISMVVGALLYIFIVGGIFYALSPNTVSPEIAEVPKAPELQSPVEASASNPSANSEAPSGDTDASSAEVGTQAVAINQRWLGVWVAEGSGQKLVITSSSVKYGADEFLWVGSRPKGVVKCCPAFYEGSTNKAELLTRMQSQQALLETPSIDTYLTKALMNNLGQGNFKKIVLADPFLRKYFFIYDQNYVYRVSRDVGDKTAFIFEQFKRQE